jgi:hypothetical protein
VFAGSPCWALVTSDAAGPHLVTPDALTYGLKLAGAAIVDGLSPSGQAKSACSAALISDRHVLCAAPCFDDNGDGQPESPMAPFADAIVFQLASGWAAVLDQPLQDLLEITLTPQ